MQTHTLAEGDTYEKVSIRFYGVGDRAAVIKAANPHASGGLRAGMVLNIPPLFADIVTETTARTGDSVGLQVDGLTFEHWESIQLTQGLDKISKFEFNAPFEPGSDVFREAFLPLRYQDVQIFVGGRLQLRGTLMGVSPVLTEGTRTVTCVGYARCGVMQDCTVPSSVFASGFEQSQGVEWLQQSLEQIAKRVCEPWGFVPVFESAPELPPDANPHDFPDGVAFGRVAMSATTKPWSFLEGLAKQRNLVMGSDREGNPVFRRSSEDTPIQELHEEDTAVVSVTLRTDPQNFFSHVTGLSPTFIGRDSASYTVENPHLRGVLRPQTFTVPDATSAAMAKAAVDARAARMFAQGINYDVDLIGTRDVNGDLWRPNTRVHLIAPSAMCYSRTEFLIRRVETLTLKESQVTRLNLVHPEAYQGGIPELLPWDELEGSVVEFPDFSGTVA